jgi:dynein light chain Tctex-type 1
MIAKEPNSFAEMKSHLEEIAKSILDNHKTDPACENYGSKESSDFSAAINSDVIKSFTLMYPTYKFCSSCLVINNKEGGVHLTSSCYWEEKTDGNIQIEKEYKAIKVFLSVFALF